MTQRRIYGFTHKTIARRIKSRMVEFSRYDCEYVYSHLVMQDKQDLIVLKPSRFNDAELGSLTLIEACKVQDSQNCVHLLFYTSMETAESTVEDHGMVSDLLRRATGNKYEFEFSEELAA